MDVNTTPHTVTAETFATVADDVPAITPETQIRRALYAPYQG